MAATYGVPENLSLRQAFNIHHLLVGPPNGQVATVTSKSTQAQVTLRIQHRSRNIRRLYEYYDEGYETVLPRVHSPPSHFVTSL